MVLAGRAALAVLGVQAASAGQVAQVGLANQAVPAASVVLENPVAQEALGNRVARVAPAALDQPDVLAVARNRQPDRAVAAAPTKWAIAAFPPAQVHGAVPSVVAAGIVLERAAAAAAPA